MGGFSERSRALVLVFVGGVLAVAAGSAIGAAKLTEVTSAAGRSITAVRTASGDSATNSTSYVDVTGATATIDVTRGTALILIQFTASSLCDQQGGFACLLRAQINGADASPGAVVFDQAPSYGSNNGQAAHSMDWSSGPLPVRSYTVQIQAAQQGEGGGQFFYLRPWHLIVERVKV